MGLYRVNKRENIVFWAILSEIITEKMAILSEINAVNFVRGFFVQFGTSFILDGWKSQELIPLSLSQ